MYVTHFAGSFANMGKKREHLRFFRGKPLETIKVLMVSGSGFPISGVYKTKI
jgi:hypothetical protein